MPAWGLQLYLKRGSGTGIFLWIFQIFKNTFFTELFRTTVSGVSGHFMTTFFRIRNVKSDWNTFLMNIHDWHESSTSFLILNLFRFGSSKQIHSQIQQYSQKRITLEKNVNFKQKRHQNDVIDVVLVSLLLTLNINTFSNSCVSNFDFEEVNIWLGVFVVEFNQTLKQNKDRKSTSCLD